MNQARTGRRPPPEAAPVAARSSTFAALRVRNYRLFFAGQMVSNTGTWMQRIAQDWLVLEITNSPLAVGITTALQFLPMLLFGLWGGLIADRFPKRLVLLITQGSMGLLAVAAGRADPDRRVAGLAGLPDRPGARVSRPSSTTPPGRRSSTRWCPQHLVRNAVALNSGNFQLARMVGPAVAGVLITAVGIGWAFALNALSFVAVIAALLAMRGRELSGCRSRRAGAGQLREGLRFVRRTPDAALDRSCWCSSSAPSATTSRSSCPPTPRTSSTAAPSLFGWLNTAMAAGSVAGALVAARRTAAAGCRCCSCAPPASALALMLLGSEPLARGSSSCVLVVVGFVSVTFNTLGNATVQLASPPELRGRVMSLYMLVFMGGTPLGSVVVGAITGAFGPRVALLVSGGACLVGVIGAAVLAARQARQAPRW